MEDKVLQDLKNMFEVLQTLTHDYREQDKLIEEEACKHKESIRELCQENEELKLKLSEYESIAVQYRDDLKHPLSDSGSIDRRLTWVTKVLSK